MKNSAATILIAGFLLSGVVSTGASARAQPDDVIARVGDQTITFSDIDVMINSSDLVGMGVPPPGTPERNHVRLIVLDKVISADLLYLDARKHGTPNDPRYRNDVENFSRSILPAVYREKHGLGNVPVTDAEVRDYFKKNMAKGTPFTPEMHRGIEATIREERFKARRAALQKELRRGVNIVVDKTKLDPKGDASRAAGEVVARFNHETITWGELRNALRYSDQRESVEGRAEILNEMIDERLALTKAKAAGLDRDPGYLTQVHEYEKVHAITLYKEKLFREWEPTDQDVRAYFEKNRAEIALLESRKIQMVVLKTEAEAEDVKKQIQSGKLTIYEAAAKYSIDPNAKTTLGEMGWVAKGTGFPALDRLTFSLKPGTLGGPVESPAGWHLVQVLEAREARYQNIKDKDTWQRAKNMLLQGRYNDYVTELRKNVFPVVVYNDVFERIVRQEQKKIDAERKKSEKPALPAAERAGRNRANP